jgi:tetratricopeptide (TPR) repeat protein
VAKNFINTIAVSILTVSIGFTSCKGTNTAAVGTADSLTLDSSTAAIVPDTNNMVKEETQSWDNAAKALTEEKKSQQASGPKKSVTLSPDTSSKSKAVPGKPKMTPLNMPNPYRPQELLDGLEKAQKGDLQGAIGDFDLCIKKNYKNYNAYFYKAKALIELNKPQEAFTNIELAIQNNQGNPVFFYYRGKLYFDAGNTEKANEDFEKALTFNPRFVDALNYRGVIKAGKGKHAEAIADYDLAIESNPDYAIAYYNKGTSQAAMQSYSEAAASFTKSIELDPKRVMAFMNRGNCQVMLKDYKSAIDDYTKAISLEPKNSDAYFNRGAAYQYSGSKNSCNDWQKALTLGNKKAAEMLKEHCK